MRHFLVLCDLHIPQITGLKLKELINSDENRKNCPIPFIFLLESVNPSDVDEASLSMVQGFYVKP